MDDVVEESIKVIINNSIREAVLKERERCAKIADGWDTHDNPDCVTAFEIAEAIRESHG